MVDRSGWSEADAAVVELGLSVVVSCVGLAVCERRREVAPICHVVHGPIVRAGEQMAKPAPKLYLPARAVRARHAV